MRTEVLRERCELGHLSPCFATDTGDNHFKSRFTLLISNESRKQTGNFRYSA